MIKFEQTGRRPDGEKLYRLIIGDKVRREGMTLDEVIAEIHRSDADHVAPLPGADEGAARQPQPHRWRAGIPKSGPGGGIRGKEKEDHAVRLPAAERRRMARKEPGERR